MQGLEEPEVEEVAPLQASDITMKMLDDAVDACAALKLEIKGLDKKKKKLNGDLSTMQAKVIGYLELLEKDEHKSKHGTFRFYYPQSYKTPKTIEEKKLFADYLKSKWSDDFFWDFFGVNSRSLKTFCDAEMKEAEDKGDFNFEIPGIVQSTSAPIVSLTSITTPQGTKKAKELEG